MKSFLTPVCTGLFLLLPLLSSAQYCIPGGDHEPEGISSFQFNSIVNYDSPYNQTHYSLYTPEQFTTTVTMGESYALQVSNPATLMDVFRMWIDLNNDGVFTGSDMLLDEENSNGTVSAYITIPSHASYQGPRRLRIINGCRYEDFDACGWDGYHQGEAEDYTGNHPLFLGSGFDYQFRQPLWSGNYRYRWEDSLA